MTESPYGYCHCGCGRQTVIASRTATMYGWVKGEPKRYINGHNHGKLAKPFAERAKITEESAGYETPCWRTTQKPGTAGYPLIIDDGAIRGAHHAMWLYHKGPVPEGLELDHLCRNRWCCNPDHLEPVTHAENVRRGAQTPLTWDEVREIRASSEKPGVLARRYGIGRKTVWAIRAGRTWAEEAA